MASKHGDFRPLRGRLSEELAALHLQARGWSILARRVRLAGVQVDLVASRSSVVAIVEVKSRVGGWADWYAMSRAVSPEQALRLRRAASSVAVSRPRATVRVDLVTVAWIWRGWMPRIRHFPAADA